MQRLAVGPVQVVGDQQQRLCAADPSQQLAERALERVAILRGVARRRCGSAGQALELGKEPCEDLAALAEPLGERIALADAQQELEPGSRRLVRGADRCVRGAVEHEHAPGRGLQGELAHQPGLARAGLPTDQHQAALAALGPLQQRAQLGELALAPDERERRRRHQRAGSTTAAEARPVVPQLERAILGQDLPLQLLERRARLEPELVQRLPRSW